MTKKTTVDVAVEALMEASAHFAANGIKIAGSEASAGSVRLVIEGEGLPEGRVEAVMTRSLGGADHQLTFRPIAS